MNEHRRQILQMLSEKKITADEAERLIAAVEREPSSGTSGGSSDASPRARAKYLRVQVDAADDLHGEGPTKVNVRVPMQLLRAGVRLAGLIPAAALRRANDAMHEQGLPIDLTQIKPENLEEIVDQLNDLNVDMDQEKGKVKVRVFCE
jgi:SHOCT-like domain